MRISDVSTQLLFTTVPIWTATANGSISGTGFIFSYNSPQTGGQSVPLLVTAKHVISNADKIFIDLHSKKDGLPCAGKSMKIELNKSSFLIHETLDVALLPVQPLVAQLEAKQSSPFFRALDLNLIPTDSVWRDLSAIETISFIGYPSGILDKHNLFPVVRQGITSTPIWSDFCGEPYFLIDAGVFPGSSGSPVLIINQGGYSLPNGGIALGHRLYFVGILLESFITKNGENPTFLGLGKVLHSKKLLSAISELVDKLFVSPSSVEKL
jgi:hypothetical protein